jgi:hypothetical protein
VGERDQGVMWWRVAAATAFRVQARRSVSSPNLSPIQIRRAGYGFFSRAADDVCK